MKTVIDNREALLRQLVLEGDAQAFFSLTKMFLQQCYLRERSSGSTSQEASRKVLAEAVELFEQIRHVTSHRLELWLEEHCSPEPVSSENTEVLIDTKIITETEAFLNNCNRELVRSGSTMKRNAIRAGNKFPQVLFRHKAAVLLLPVAAAALIVATVTFAMVRFHLTVELRFNSSNGSAGMVFPPTAWGGGDHPTTSVVDQQSEDSTATLSGNDTLTADSLSGDSLSRESSSAQPVVSPVTAPQRRSLPPVRPKARLKRPPPPPPVEQPALQVPSISEEIVEPVQQPSISPEPSTSVPEQEESEPMY